MVSRTRSKKTRRQARGGASELSNSYENLIENVKWCILTLRDFLEKHETESVNLSPSQKRQLVNELAKFYHKVTATNMSIRESKRSVPRELVLEFFPLFDKLLTWMLTRNISVSFDIPQLPEYNNTSYHIRARGGKRARKTKRHYRK